MRYFCFWLCASAVFVAATALSGCAGAQSAGGLLGAGPQSGLPARQRAQPRIAHLIVIVQQHRTFDDLFSGYPGANAPRFGCAPGGGDTRSDGCPPGDTQVPLKAVRLAARPCRLESSFSDYFSIAWDDGKMDGWKQLDPKAPFCPYTHVERRDTQAYWSLARRFAIADHAFASTHFGFFPDQLYLIAGTSEVARKVWVVGMPDELPWSCDAPAGTVTGVLAHGRLELFGGPFPCFAQFPTMANLFDKAGVSWKYYANADVGDWDPFETIKYVFEGPDRKRDLSSPASNVLRAIATGNLPAVSWVLSPYPDSDAPQTHGGPRWVNAVVGALRRSNYWSTSAIVVVWDNEGDGQYYDDVAPPQLDDVGLGFRVPMILISPYAKRHYVSHTEYEFGSLLKFMEENWGLPPLGGYATDRRANSISDMFDFSR